VTLHSPFRITEFQHRKDWKEDVASEFEDFDYTISLTYLRRCRGIIRTIWPSHDYIIWYRGNDRQELATRVGSFASVAEIPTDLHPVTHSSTLASTHSLTSWTKQQEQRYPNHWTWSGYALESKLVYLRIHHRTLLTPIQTSFRQTQRRQNHSRTATRRSSMRPA
jgi:hypothetical protein